jgi:diacylglycerol diphosphate phosphatase/phosphatidate phosphatase
MAAMGAVGLGVYEAHPAPTRSFPIYNTDGGIAYPEFAYPLRKNIIPIWLAALLAFIVPFVFFALFQIRLRSLESLLDTTMGLLESLSKFYVFVRKQ